MTEHLKEEPSTDLDDDDSSAVVSRPAERAAFLDDFPDCPELSPLVHAFEVGNYAELRKLEQQLRQQCADPELLALGRELIERTAPDPTAKKLLLLSIGFFLFILIWVYAIHGH